MMSSNTMEQLDELVRHNMNLVATAQKMRQALEQAHNAIRMVLDLSEPIAEQHDDEPVEWVVHGDNLDELRQVLLDFPSMAQ